MDFSKYQNLFSDFRRNSQTVDSFLSYCDEVIRILGPNIDDLFYVMDMDACKSATKQLIFSAFKMLYECRSSWSDLSPGVSWEDAFFKVANASHILLTMAPSDSKTLKHLKEKEVFLKIQVQQPQLNETIIKQLLEWTLLNLISFAQNYFKSPKLHQKTLNRDDYKDMMLLFSIICPLYREYLGISSKAEIYAKFLNDKYNFHNVPILLLKEVLWNLLINSEEQGADLEVADEILLSEMKNFVLYESNVLLKDLLDWNCREQYVAPEHFVIDPSRYQQFFDMDMIEGSRQEKLLKLAPFLVDFSTRLCIFKHQSQKPNKATIPILVPRNSLLARAKKYFLDIAGAGYIRDQVKVQYVDEHGEVEPGWDMGGLLKDLLTNLVPQILEMEPKLFEEAKDRRLYPNPNLQVKDNMNDDLKFIGLLVGKAILEEVHLDLFFHNVFLRRLKEKDSTIVDLEDFDPELHASFQYMKESEDPSGMGIYFVMPGQETKELIPNGDEVLVCRENVEEYIKLVVNEKLNIQMKQLCGIFKSAVETVLGTNCFKFFTEREIQMLISGSDEKDLDLTDWQLNTVYDGYAAEDETIMLLWKIITNLDTHKQKRFLKFVTACSRPPTLGFAMLRPPFCIRWVDMGTGSEFQGKIPASSTCSNVLHLPPYTSEQILHDKLLDAILGDHGFQLV